MKILLAVGTFFASVAIGVGAEKNPLDEFLSKEPLPKSYTIFTKHGEETYNYTQKLGEFSPHGIDLAVWMTCDKSVLSPGENLTLTVHYENQSKKDIWVPPPAEWSLGGFARVKSGATALGSLSCDPHGSALRVKPAQQGSFEVRLESPIEESGFLQVDLTWGALEDIVPYPVTVECKASLPSKQPQENKTKSK